jgi:hypothetical protein
MFKKISIVDVKALIKAFSDMDCGKKDIVEFLSKIFEIKQHERFQMEGYETPENFPSCCKNHEGIFNIGLEYLAKFPNGCEAHKKLNTAKWFNKENSIFNFAI